MSTVLLKLKDISRSHGVTYVVNVVMSYRRCNVETVLLLQITNRKAHLFNGDDLE